VTSCTIVSRFVSFSISCSFRSSDVSAISRETASLLGCRAHLSTNCVLYLSSRDCHSVSHPMLLVLCCNRALGDAVLVWTKLLQGSNFMNSSKEMSFGLFFKSERVPSRFSAFILSAAKTLKHRTLRSIFAVNFVKPEDKITIHLTFIVKALCYKPEGRGFETWWGERIVSIYLILPAALSPGVHSASNKNEYQK
jgi:hypothetical protein